MQPFMKHTDPSSFYNDQIAHHQPILTKLEQRISMLSRLRLLVILVGIAGVGYLSSRNEDAAWAALIGALVIFILAVRLHGKFQKNAKRLKARIRIQQQELLALDGNISHFSMGESWVDTTHPFSYDLDIFGKGSIYQLLCRCATKDAEDVLATRIRTLTGREDVVLHRQSILKELSFQPVFLEDFRTAGASISDRDEPAATAQPIRNWLADKDDFINDWMAKLAAIVLPLSSLAMLAWCFYEGRFIAWYLIVFACNWLVLGLFSKKIQHANQQISSTASLIENYALLLQETSGLNSNNSWLNEVVIRAKSSLMNINGFRKLVSSFDSRNNGMTGPIMNSLFVFDIINLLRLETWRKKHRQAMQDTINDLTTLDVMVSCAVYTFNNPSYQYPSIVGNAIVAKSLRHPLLKPHAAVGNSFSLGENQEQIYLLTGANMTGKSTFIRTLGVSVIFTALGLPVAADFLSLPMLGIYTSIRVTDSVQDDISYFKAELNRIKSLMDEVGTSERQYLVLLDEPLRGTNSADKQEGTRAIIDKLLDNGILGIVATHDTALCSLEQEHHGKVINYHFESKVEDGLLTFDFRLKSGPSTSNNATLLMKMMGIVNG